VEPAFDHSELAARAAWLASLSDRERAELVDQPIAAVERRYASWRRAGAVTGRC